MSAIEHAIRNPLLDALTTGLSMQMVPPRAVGRWRTGEITRPNLEDLQCMVPGGHRDARRQDQARDNMNMREMYLYRTNDGRIVAIEHDVHDEVDTSAFKAPIIGGRAMAREAAMGLLRQFGGIVITAQGPHKIAPQSA